MAYSTNISATRSCSGPELHSSSAPGTAPAAASLSHGGRKLASIFTGKLKLNTLMNISAKLAARSQNGHPRKPQNALC